MTHRYRRRSRRMHLERWGLLLALAGALAGALAAAQSGEALPANIPGVKRQAPAPAGERHPDKNAETNSQPSAEPNSQRRAKPGSQKPSEPRQKRRATTERKRVRSTPFTGDRGLQGQIDLARAVFKAGRYTVDIGAGKRAVLTLDPALQQAAEAALKTAKAPQGAVVVMAVDGRILALAGRRYRGSKFRRDSALALAAWAPAASVFKIVTAAALLKAGVTPKSRICYHGGLRSVEASNLTDNRARDTLCGNLTDGVARSQNAIIAKLVHRHVRPRVLRATAAAFGFYKRPAFALPTDPNRSDIPGEPLAYARVAAGFWHTDLSPVGGALVANTVASGGLAVTPRIVAAVETGDTVTSVEAVPPQRVVDARVARDLTRMMAATTESGTGYKGFHDLEGRKFFPKMTIAGKTGTLTRSSPSYLEYSWFVGFAPSDKPAVSIAVLLGNSPRWHLKAHTAARMVLQALF